MIIYEHTISYFINQCKSSKVDALISEIKINMKEKMGRGVSPSEERSWRTTLVGISKNLQKLRNKDKQYILLEFKLPLVQKRVDVILVGASGKSKSLLIIELKGWSTSFATDMHQVLRINSRYQYVNHPSQEAGEYRDALTNQFTDVVSHFQTVDAIAWLPNYKIVKNDPIYEQEFSDMLEKVDLYTKSTTEELQNYLYEMFRTSIDYTDVDMLNRLEYKPSKSFQRHLKNAFQDIKLVGSQTLAYETIVFYVKQYLVESQKKTLITISGYPGSGKTIVAFKLLAYLYGEEALTTKLQLPGPEFRDAVRKQFKENILNNMIGGAYAKGDHDVVIIDEAHKAMGQLGAKAFYKGLFDNENFVIALIDDLQVISKRGILKTEMIEIAKEKKFRVIEIELKEQFRNAGDASYIDWLRNWIYGDDNQQDYYTNANYHFSILDEEQFNAQYYKDYYINNVRLLSFWTQPWNALLEKGEPARRVKIGDVNYSWNPNWKWKDEYEKNSAKKLSSDLIKEIINPNFNTTKKGYQYVGYFNTSQGSEFDYVYVHLPKLFFLNDNNELDVDLSQLDMYDMKTQVWTKNKQPDTSKERKNATYFKNRLIVNLTRGTKGTFVFIEDDKLRDWLGQKLLNQN